MAIVTLYKTEWVSLKKVVEPELGINNYIFSHETRCQGRIIAVLPFKVEDGIFKYLVKQEITPCWSLSPAFSSLTGGWEGGDPVHTAKLELEEECGYTVEVDKFIELGTSYASKSSDTVYALFSVNLTGLTPSEPKGDGSRLEKEAKSFWFTESELVNVKDPQVALMLNRLKYIQGR